MKPEIGKQIGSITYARAALLCLLATLGGLAIGRFATPTKTVTEYAERVVTDTSAAERVRELEQQVARLEIEQHREETIVERPDGTKETKIVTDTKLKSDEVSVRESDAVRVEHTTTERVVTQTVTVENDRPDWRVSLLGGADVSKFTPTYGVQVERRIAGPFSAGVWVLPMSRAGGVTLSVEF